MNLEILKNKKKQLGLSNVELSQISGVPLGTLSKIMAGIITNPKLSTLQAMTSALGCTLDDLYDDNRNIKETGEEKQYQLFQLFNELTNEGKDKVIDYTTMVYDSEQTKIQH